MHSAFQYPSYDYHTPPELSGLTPTTYPVVIVGAGPVGLAAALDCHARGIPALIVDEDNTVSMGSRGLCYAKRALEILDRIGVGDPVVDKGVCWNVGRTFFGEKEVFNFDLLPEADHQRPGMVNLQQYYLELYQVERCQALGIDIRWKNKVVSINRAADHVTLQIDTPEGIYSLDAQWLIVCDGARSPIRSMMGLDIEGKVFMDRFLIADVIMKAAFPAERWFWFDPPFHRNQSVLLHREADDVWRIDFQLGWDVDPQEEKKPENVIPRIKAMLGDEREFELEWVSIYTFQCRRMQSFNHGRVLFAGDAAHQVSPFGARGANSGIQDTDNLIWKLKLVMDGKAPATLLDTYSEERCFAADENILNSTRSTDFITPKSNTSKTFRNAVLQLAEQHTFARKLVNSGRLSVPSYYTESTLNTADTDAFESPMMPGAPMDDAPVAENGQASWLLQHFGRGFQLLAFTDPSDTVSATAQALLALDIPVETVCVCATPQSTTHGLRVLHDVKGLVAKRYDATPGTAYLIRPDQHVCARWRALDGAAASETIQAAVAQACGIQISTH